MKLHLGCGKRFIPGFLHVDIADFPHVDIRARIDSLPMIASGLVELIYCSHAFEYLDRQQGAEALREWLRILKPDGVLRLAVPDFEALLGVYGQTRNLADILGPLYGRMQVQAPSGVDTLYHRTAYDYASLEQLCVTAGFRSVRRFDWRETSHSGVDDFSQAYWPHADKERGRLLSLNVEAIK